MTLSGLSQWGRYVKIEIKSQVFSHSDRCHPSTALKKINDTSYVFYASLKHLSTIFPSGDLYLINTLCEKQRWDTIIVGSSQLKPHDKSRHFSEEPFSHLLSRVISSSYCELEDNARVCLSPQGEDLCSLSHLYGLPLTGGVPRSRRRVRPHTRPTWRAGMSSDNFSQLTSLCVPTLHLFLLWFLLSAINCIAFSSPKFNAKHVCFCKEQSQLKGTYGSIPQAQVFDFHCID